MSAVAPTLTTLAISLDAGIAEVRLNRPEKSNAIDDTMWQELRTAMRWADAAPEVRVAILSGAGRQFCAGIDLAMLAGIAPRIARRDSARSREALRSIILDLQDCLASVERCRKPVLAAIHGACIGGAIDLVTCCDMRYASIDARFSVREIDIAMAADVGTLQRLPRLVPDGIARELCFTGRTFDAREAQAMGLAARVFPPEALLPECRQIALDLAAKSRFALSQIKRVINLGYDLDLPSALELEAQAFALCFASTDPHEGVKAFLEKRPPQFKP